METSASENARVFESILQDGFFYSREHQADIRSVCRLCKTVPELVTGTV